jgi:hypothetical protein
MRPRVNWSRVFWRVWALAALYLFLGWCVLMYFGDTGWQPYTVLAVQTCAFAFCVWGWWRTRRTRAALSTLHQVGRNRWTR